MISYNCSYNLKGLFSLLKPYTKDSITYRQKEWHLFCKDRNFYMMFYLRNCRNFLTYVLIELNVYSACMGKPKTKKCMYLYKIK